MLYGTPPTPTPTPPQLADVEECLRQLVGKENEAALILELGRLKLGSLPSSLNNLCATLQTKETGLDGVERLPAIEERLNFWRRWAKAAGFPLVARAAVRLLSMHTTSASTERNWSLWGRLYSKLRSRLAIARAEMLVYIKANLGTWAAVDDDEAVMLSVLEEPEE
jgi:hypothetical protein